MPLTMIEGAVDTLRAYLVANLATHVAAVNTAHSGDGLGITITTPGAFYVSEPTMLFNAPFAMILGDTSSPTVDGHEHFKSRHDLVVLIVEEDQDHDVRMRRLYRQVEAIVKCIRAGRTTTLQLVGFNRPYAGYSPRYTVSKDRYRQDAGVFCWLELPENN